MLTAIGSLLGRTASKPASAAVRAVPSPSNSNSNSMPTRQRQAEPRDTYARIFRWTMPADFAEPPVNVEIIGSFTRWQTVPLTHDPVQNTWAVTIDGIPAKRTHHYVLLVNGKPVYDPACDGFALPAGFEEEEFALPTEKGPRVLMLFSQAK